MGKRKGREGEPGRVREKSGESRLGRGREEQGQMGSEEEEG